MAGKFYPLSLKTARMKWRSGLLYNNHMFPRDRSADAKNPTGFWGRFAARLMAIGHKPVYKAAAAALELRKDDSLLDIGCGSGFFLKKYADLPSSISGLDHSKDMVELAARNNRNRVQKGSAEFKTGEAEKLPWPDKSFTAVSMIETFYWVKPLEALKEIYRVLKPGGRAVIGIGLNLDDGQDHSKYTRTFGMTFYSEAQIRGFLEQAGFKDISFTFGKGLGMPRAMVARARRPL